MSPGDPTATALAEWHDWYAQILDAVEKLVTSGTAAVANLIVSPDGASVTIDGWTNRDR